MTPTLSVIEVTTDASGDFEGHTVPLHGRVLQVRYVPDGSTPLATGADLDIVGAMTGVVVAAHDDIGTSAFTRCYRQATHGVDGSASLYAATGEPVEDYVYLAGERLKLTIANGGDTLSGKFFIVTG